MSLSSIAAIAQHAADTTSSEPAPLGGYFSNDAKWIMVYVFTFILIIIVLRTFRNKPEV